MEKYMSPQETLTEIRHLMERSSRFMSLSGLSGIMAGIYAILGAAAAYYYAAAQDLLNQKGYDFATTGDKDRLVFLLTDATLVLVLAVGTGIWLTTRKAKEDGNSLLDAAAKKLVINLAIPLVAGGLFCVGLLYHGDLIFIVPAMLTFYGLALVHASKYTRDDVRSLGIAQIALGLLSLFIAGYGLLLWTIGFGALHIAYGTYMYLKYEK